MTNYGNRGKNLESLIELTNSTYLILKKGNVVKLPHPFQTLKVKGAKVEGFFKRGYLVDYVGISECESIIFDAKELHGKSFPFKNITDSQIRLLSDWDEQGANSFLLVHFKDLDRYFKLNISKFNYLQMIMEEQNKKSINIKYFEEFAEEIFIKEGILDYLKVIK